MKISSISSNKHYSSYEQNSADIIKWPLINSLETYFHESQFTKHIYSMTLEGNTLLQIQKLWGVIIYALCQYLSTNKSWPEYKSLKVEHHNIYFFILSPDTHPKFSTAKENYESFPISLRVHIFKYDTISSSKVTKWHVKIITYMNNDNGFDLLISLVFDINTQLGGLGPKSQYLVMSSSLGEG